MKIQSVLIDLSQSKKISTAFKSNYSKLRGVFISGLTDPMALVNIGINAQNIVADGQFPAAIIATNDALSWRDVYWQVEKNISADNITIEFETSATNKVYVNFLVE